MKRVWITIKLAENYELKKDKIYTIYLDGVIKEVD